MCHHWQHYFSKKAQTGRWIIVYISFEKGPFFPLCFYYYISESFYLLKISSVIFSKWFGIPHINSLCINKRFRFKDLEMANTDII